MINYQDIAAVVRRSDDESAIGIETVMTELGVITEDAMRAAHQRALRMYLIRNHRELPTEATHVSLPEDSTEELSALAAVWLDGFVTGMRIIESWIDGQHRMGR